MNSKPDPLVFLASLAHLTIELCSNYLPVIYPVLIATLGLSYSQVGTITLVAITATSLPQVLFGYLSDRWDPYRLMVLSVLWIGLTMGLVGFVGSYPSLLLVVGLGTLGSALFHPAGAALTAAGGGGTRKGTAMSVFAVGGNLGTALGPLLITAAVAIMGLPGTIILTPIALFLGVYLHTQLRQTEQFKMSKDSRQTGTTLNGFRVGLLLIVVAAMTRSWFQSSFMTYLPVWIESQGQTVIAGGRMLFLFSVFVSAGSLTGGMLSDRIGHWQVMAFSMALLGPALWLVLSNIAMPQILPIAIMGFLLGTTFPVAVVMAQEAWPTGIGLASALVMGLGWLPGGLGAATTGLIADRWSLATGLQTLILPPILGAGAVILYAVLKQVRDRKEKNVIEMCDHPTRI